MSTKNILKHFKLSTFKTSFRYGHVIYHTSVCISALKLSEKEGHIQSAFFCVRLLYLFPKQYLTEVATVTSLSRQVLETTQHPALCLGYCILSILKNTAGRNFIPTSFLKRETVKACLTSTERKNGICFPCHKASENRMTESI